MAATAGGGPLPDDLRSQLAKIDCAALCDVGKDTVRVMDAGIRRIGGLAVPKPKMIGRAVTVKVDDDFLAVIAALKKASPGDVLVVQNVSGQRAMMGELFANEAHRAGLSGMCVEGNVRDSQSINAIDFPVYSRGTHPNAGTAYKKAVTLLEPITCGGVDVNPGDIVFGDADGVLVCTEEECRQWLPKALEINDAEAQLLQRLQRGEGLATLTNFDEHWQRVESGDSESRLAFRL